MVIKEPSETLNNQTQNIENSVNDNTIKPDKKTIEETEKSKEIKPPRRLSIYIDNKSKLEDSAIISNSRALRLFSISGY